MKTSATGTIAGVLTGLCVSHQQVDLNVIESAAPGDTSGAMESLLDHEPVLESFVLSTCNRAEWYIVTETAAIGRSVLEASLADSVLDHGEWLGHDEAIEHLIRVGAGLESMVIGEDEILGQLRTACITAGEIGALGPLLDETLWKAIHCGERVRTETGINEGVTSLGRAAVHQAGNALDLDGAVGLVVGAGDMASVAAHALSDAGISRLTVANRTEERATRVANSVPLPSTVVGLDEIPSALDEADVVITATGSPEPIITGDHVSGTGRAVVVDIAQPRDVKADVDALSSIERYDLDDIEAVTRVTNAEREEAANVAEAMVDNAVENLRNDLKRKQADDVIATMYASADSIKERELAEAKSRMNAGEHPTETVLEDFADAIVGHLLAAPTKSLRDAAAADDWETIQTALRIFDPEFSVGSVTVTSGESAPEVESDSTSTQR